MATWKDKSTRNPTTKASLCTEIIRLGKQKNCIQDGLVRISLCPPPVLTPEIISFLGTIIFYTRSVIREKMAFCRCCCTLVSNIVYLLKVYCYYQANEFVCTFNSHTYVCCVYSLFSRSMPPPQVTRLPGSVAPEGKMKYLGFVFLTYHNLGEFFVVKIFS